MARIYSALVFHDDEGACLLGGTEADEAAVEAAKSYTSLVHEVLLALVSQKQFKHIMLIKSQPPDASAVPEEAPPAAAAAPLGADTSSMTGEQLLRQVEAEVAAAGGAAEIKAGDEEDSDGSTDGEDDGDASTKGVEEEVEEGEAPQSSRLYVAFGKVELDEEENIVQVFDLRSVLDIEAILTTGLGSLPALMKGLVAMVSKPAEATQVEGEEEEEELLGEVPVMEITDAKLQAAAMKLNLAIDVQGRYDEAMSEEAEFKLVEAIEERVAQEAEEKEAATAAAPAPAPAAPLAIAAAEAQEAPVQLGEVVELLAAYLVACLGGAKCPPNFLQRSLGFVTGAVDSGRDVVGRVLGGRSGKMHAAVIRTLWRLEELAVKGSRVAAKVAIKSVRPILVGLILRRAMQTLSDSQDLELRTAKQPGHKQVDYYYSHLLGKNWKEQFEKDMVAAIQEVDEGLITDEINHEKRKVQATLLRRLEVEEWDKERMKHFYYGSYGLGEWHLDMDEALSNPFFMGARAWNGVENWVGEHKTFPNDLPAHTYSDVERSIHTLETARGAPLSARQKAALRSSERARAQPADQVAALCAHVGEMVDPERVRAALEAKREAGRS